MSYRGNSREIELKLIGIGDVVVKKDVLIIKFGILKGDLAEMFNTDEKVPSGRKLC